MALREIGIVNEHDRILARALAELERDRTYALDHALGASHWAVMHGLDKERADSLLSAGRLMLTVPDAERQVRDGEITPQAAGVVGRLVPPTPRLEPTRPVPPEIADAEEAAVTARAERMLVRAQETSQKELRREVAEVVESVKQGEAVVPLRFFVKERARDEWRYARKLAARGAKRGLTDGEAFCLVVADYVKRHDRDGLAGRSKPRARRAPPTSERPGARGVPAEVRRAVRARSGGHCEFPGCPEGRFLELCHIRAHADGGDREAGNFADLCRSHHADFDLGTLAFVERTAAGVTFVDTVTGELFVPSPKTRAADVLPKPERGGEDSRCPRRPAAGDAESPSGGVRESAPRWKPSEPRAAPPPWRRRAKRRARSPAMVHH